MNSYYDTGVLLKLYTALPESECVQNFVRLRKDRIWVTDLHVAECVSALRLKAFRKECSEDKVTAAIELIKADLRGGVLQVVEVDWSHAWQECRLLSDQFASRTGARAIGLKVLDPTAR